MDSALPPHEGSPLNPSGLSFSGYPIIPARYFQGYGLEPVGAPPVGGFPLRRIRSQCVTRLPIFSVRNLPHLLE